MTLGRVCVYCASSRKSDAAYYEAAASLGRSLAQRGIAIVYGGGAVGSMGALADAALAEGGKVIGVLPRFMYDLEWGHPRLTELRLVGDLHERKRLMIEEVDAIVALPGGSGTLEELMEAITWKRLGLHGHPIVLVNVRSFLTRSSRCSSAASPSVSWTRATATCGRSSGHPKRSSTPFAGHRRGDRTRAALRWSSGCGGRSQRDCARLRSPATPARDDLEVS